MHRRCRAILRPHLLRPHLGGLELQRTASGPSPGAPPSEPPRPTAEATPGEGPPPFVSPPRHAGPTRT
eukprot:1597899-Pyramimonas_sp.AAC.1